MIVAAIASDARLFELLVLKGGNALDLIYLEGERGSLDLDYSLAGDLADVEDTKIRLFTALRRAFDAVGLLVFDEQFGPRPRGTTPPRWGGYEASFKLIERGKATGLEMDQERLRRDAVRSGPAQQRRFVIQLSKYEYCDGATVATVGNATVRVYTPVMMMAEKLRAICQQMPEYPLRVRPAPRARDFYDIARLGDLLGARYDRAAMLEVLSPVFAAKDVPLSLLGQLAATRSFHALDWPTVELTVRGSPQPFDHYFDRVLALVEELDLGRIE
ncbi:MAG: nucleotidyl transferase AbiEii/AbiGii toxin family protein [Gemmatimonadales bacterium]